MNSTSTSLCYYPTTTVFIDDNKGYLDYMKLNFADVIPCQFLILPIFSWITLNNIINIKRLLIIVL